MDRPTALTTPAVTEPANPSGFPMATTNWPTRRREASPSVAGERSGAAARRTAMSDRGSVPTILMSSSRPSTSVAIPRSVPSTTCAEVSRKPSLVTATALPLPSTRRGAPTRRHTRRLATAGDTTSATRVTTCE